MRILPPLAAAEAVIRSVKGEKRREGARRASSGQQGIGPVVEKARARGRAGLAFLKIAELVVKAVKRWRDKSLAQFRIGARSTRLIIGMAA